MNNRPNNNGSGRVENILKCLHLNPHVGVQSKDDAKCKALLMQLGMLELLTRSVSPSLSVMRYPAHPTHWIIALLWSGYSERGGNGYQVICLPKSQVPEQGVQQIVEEVLDQYGGYGQEDGVGIVPYDWREQN
jgi:hypothetical protein